MVAHDPLRPPPSTRAHRAPLHTSIGRSGHIVLEFRKTKKMSRRKAHSVLYFFPYLATLFCFKKYNPRYTFPVGPLR